VKRMTSVLTPAVVAALLIALTFSVVTLRSAIAQTLADQPPAAQTPTSPTPAPQSPSTPPAAQPSALQPPAPPLPDPQAPTVAPAGQPGTQTPPQAVGTDTDHGTALMLLDRIATVLDAAVKGKASTSDVVGTTGSDEGGSMKVVIDRGALDEIRAELTQIRLLLKNEKK
jgi:hypothetical protein